MAGTGTTTEVDPRKRTLILFEEEVPKWARLVHRTRRSSGRIWWEWRRPDVHRRSSLEFELTAQTIVNRCAQAERDAGVRHEGLITAERQELTRQRRP